MVDRLVTPPEGEVVTLALAKKHLLVDHTVDDELISSCIGAATTYAEEFCNRGFLDQDWQTLLPGWPVADPCRDVFVELKRGNLLAESSPVVKYVDEAGAEQTLSSSVYLVDSASVPARIRLAPDQTWPSIQARWDAVRITYSVGWAEGEVPAPIVHAILLLVAQLYEHRVPEVTGTIVAAIKFSFEALLAPYRIHAV